MGCFIPYGVPCAKGPIPYCLEEVSRRPDADLKLKSLADAVKALGPRYRGLEAIFDTHLVAHVIAGTAEREAIATHLK